MSTESFQAAFQLPDKTPATGLTLSDFDVTVFSVNKSTGAIATVSSAVDATAEVGLGIYALHNITVDLLTFNYPFFVIYNGATVLRDIRAWGQISLNTEDVRDAILSDSTAFAGANIDATISSRMATTHINATAGAVDTVTTNTDMRGTDSAALASDYTSARAGYLDNINGHTAQTGDSFARLGAPAGASVSADVAAVKVETNSLDGTKIPDTISLANINAEVDTALTDIGLDHLISTSVVGADVTDNSIIAYLASKGATADWDTFVNTTDSLEAIADGSAPTAAAIADAIWDEAQADHVAAGSFGEVATEIASILADTGTDGVIVATNNDKTGYSISGTKTTLDALNDISAANVNTEVDTALATTTYAELAAVPAATSTLADKINWLFALARNKITQTSTTQTLRNDADSADIATSTVSDAAGTSTRGEFS